MQAVVLLLKLKGPWIHIFQESQFNFEHFITCVFIKNISSPVLRLLIEHYSVQQNCTQKQYFLKTIINYFITNKMITHLRIKYQCTCIAHILKMNFHFKKYYIVVISYLQVVTSLPIMWCVWKMLRYSITLLKLDNAQKSKRGHPNPTSNTGKKKPGPLGHLRPIILLSVLRKILAISMIGWHMEKLLKKISPTQSAYQHGWTTTEQVFSMKILAEKAITSSNY